MLFFPYRADIPLHGWPLLTLLLVLTCLGVYGLQALNQQRVQAAAQSFCAAQQPRAFRLAVGAIYGSASSRHCLDILFGMHTARARDAYLQQRIAHARSLAGMSPSASAAYLTRTLNRHYGRFALAVPSELTQSLWYDPHSWNVWRMLTAAVAHASWTHVLGNLVFLFAFAATLEVLLGGVVYVAVLLALAVLSHSVYSVTMIAVQDALPTVGLSGVVYGAMALFAFLLPTARIRCFAWLVVFFKRFSLPAWTLVGGFVGLDVYNLFSQTGGPTINFAAHVGGAAFGFLIGAVFLRGKRARIREEAAHEKHNNGAPESAPAHWSSKTRRKW